MRIFYQCLLLTLAFGITSIFAKRWREKQTLHPKTPKSKNRTQSAKTIDLLRAIRIPFVSRGVDFVAGPEGFPAFRLRPDSDLKAPYRLHLPPTLFRDFAIGVTLRPDPTPPTGYVFAVVNPTETVVQLGVRLSPAADSEVNVTLFYTDVDMHLTSQPLAIFTLPPFHAAWTRLAFRLKQNNITLYYNCEEHSSVIVRRIPKKLIFDTASTLYIGQAGPLLTGHYQGGLQELKLYSKPGVAEIYCDAAVQENGDGRGDVGIDEMDVREVDELQPLPSPGKSEPGPPPLIIPPPPGSFSFEKTPGPKGQKGRAGRHGKPGLKGDAGAMTEKDLLKLQPKLKGDRGEPGIPGLPGPVGPKGEKGECVYNSLRPSPSMLDGVNSELWNEGDYGSGDDQGGKEWFSGTVHPGTPCMCNISLKQLENYSSLRGRDGLPGVKGDPGPPGLPGPSGIGLPGSVGLKGDEGQVGTPGLQGQKGEPGVDGIPGTSGPRGLPGPPGPPGIVNGHAPFDLDTAYGSGLYPSSGDGPFGPFAGRPGVPGVQGPPGLPGPEGIRGERGYPGEKGDRGDIGSKGEKGNQGISGFPGEKGDPGLDGRDGIAGLPGLKGERGEKGDLGPPGIGIPGPPGPPGISGIYQGIGGAADVDYASHFKGISGIKGEKGPKGDRGSRGKEGSVGPIGPKGEIGPPGLPGTSAVITQEGETALLIKGEPGERGRRGKKGKIGPPGPSGPTGPVGEIGLPGFPGRLGSPGPKGETGVSVKGEKGEQGPPGIGGYLDSDGINVVSIGPKGEKGDLGSAGPVGPAGRPGLKGDAGRPGKDGTKGEPGPPGLPGGLGDGRYVSLTGPPGPPGPPGLPGESIPGPAGLPGPPGAPGSSGHRNPFWTGPDNVARRGVQVFPGPPGPPGPPGAPGQPGKPAIVNAPEELRRPTVVPGAVTFKNMDTLLRMSDISPLGTMAFVLEEESLLVRVSEGWQYVALGSLVIQSTPSPTKPPTTHKPFSPPVDSLRLEKAPRLRMAALNQPMTGDMHGVRGADYECYRQSRRANLRGTFRAFLASRVQNLDSIVRFQDAPLPVLNLKGEVIFNAWKDVFTGAGAPFPYPPRIYSFDGRNVLTDNRWPQKLVWHGSDKHGVRDLESYCDAWHSAGLGKVGMASSLLRGRLLDQERYSCNNAFVVLCIEATSQDDYARKKRDTAGEMTWEEFQQIEESLL